MFVDLVDAPSISATRYERLLAQGYFRSGGRMFRSELMCVEDEIWTPVNIRLDLQDFSLRKSQRKLLNRCRASFRTTVAQLEITEEKDALYRGFKHRFKGFVHDSLALFLHEGHPHIEVETWEIGIWDGEKLIALSLVDRAGSSVASLLCVYHPDYARWSLGQCTLILEALWAQESGVRWFYPGYVFDRPSLFDYKLRMGAMRYRTSKGRWASWSHFDGSDTAAFRVLEATEALEQALKRRLLPADKFVYPLYSLAFFQPGMEFLDLPTGFAFESGTEVKWVAGYHPVEMRFVLAEWTDLTLELQALKNAEWEELAGETAIQEVPALYRYGRRKMWFSDASALANHLYRALRPPGTTPFIPV